MEDIEELLPTSKTSHVLVTEDEDEKRFSNIPRIRQDSKNSSEEVFDSLEYEEDCFYSFVCSTDTPSFDDVDAAASEATDGSEPYWTFEDQLFNDLELSDSEQSDVDFEQDVTALPAAVKPDGDSTAKPKTKFIAIKSGDIVKKIRFNWNDLKGPYLAKRRENYRQILKLIKERMRKNGEPPMVATPDDSELAGLTEEEKQKQKEVWQQELAKVEEEIQTLKHVLQSKMRDSQELKRKLGISVWREITDDLSQGVRNVKESQVYQNVEETVSQLGKAVTQAPIYQNVEGKISQIGKVVSETPAYQRTESVVKATAESTRTLLGGLTGGFTHKMGQLKNSDSFRSLEEKVGSAYENVKTKVTSSRSSSMQSFDEALREETARRATSPTSPTIPEGKQLS